MKRVPFNPPSIKSYAIARKLLETATNSYGLEIKDLARGVQILIDLKHLPSDPSFFGLNWPREGQILIQPKTDLPKDSSE